MRRQVILSSGRRSFVPGALLLPGASIFLMSLLWVCSAQAATTFSVNSTGDTADAVPGDGFCDDGGGFCTLRAAIQEANALAGADTINFNILPSGPKTIAPLVALPSISSQVTIDGTTQPGYAGAPIIELNASGAGANALNLLGGSSSSTIRGLIVNRSPGSAIRVFSANCIIAGNYLGTDSSGTSQSANSVGVFVQGNTNRIGGTVAADRNVISGNSVDGIQIFGAGVTGNVIQGNYIGLDKNGAALGNGSQGVAIFGGPITNVVGGTAAGAGNVISANGNDGVLIGNATTTGNRVEGNFIGTDPAGADGSVGNLRGVEIDASSFGNTVGGTAAGATNRIAYNINGGVELTPSAGIGNQISSNEIYSNGTLGIDLGENGVSVNDVGDADTGSNDFQNFPVLSAAMTNGAGRANFAGSLNSGVSLTYRIEFFASSAKDPTGFGEGERYLGSTNVTTDASGNAVIGVTLITGLAAGEFVTATATDPSSNTSEFSKAITAVGSLVVTTTADSLGGDTSSVQNLIATPGPDGRISLREAITATNATGGADTILFGIPLTDSGHLYYQDDSVASSLTNVQPTTLDDASISDFDPDYPAGLTRSWYRIQPSGSALPQVNDPVTLDATTQPGAVTGGPVIELDGSAAGAGANGLSSLTGPSSFSGFCINGFNNDAVNLHGPGGYTVTGNYVGTDASGTKAVVNGGSGVFLGELSGPATMIGGNTAAARNIISGNAQKGVFLWAFGAPGISSQVIVQGNYVGTDVTGTAGFYVQPKGIYAEYTGGHLFGGPGPGEGNLVSGNAGFGIELNGNPTGSGTQANNNTIEGNFIGTDASGTAVIGNGQHGILFYGIVDASSAANNNTVRGNVIVGADGGNDGIYIEGNADGNLIENNFIGTDTTGTLNLGNTGNGIEIVSDPGFLATGNTVRGNTIRFNGLDGVRITGDSSITLTQNQISSNTGLGIDLNADGVTANDAGDVDSGPNALLNFPFVTAALESGGVMTAYFKLDLPAGWYRVEFFKNPSGADPSGNGEGEIFVGSTDVNHPGGGPANFNTNFPGSSGDVITATTTACTDGTCSAFTDTSEFSNAVTAVPTAVKLASFTASPRDGAVDLAWRTESELNNLGFHLYRAPSPAGPFERITETPIAGLGSSPTGASYGYRDTGLTNGTPYFYELEDIETTGKTTLHGPISATPGAKSNSDSDEEPGSDAAQKTYGEPSATSLSILQRSPRGMLIELVTGGFLATPLDDGTVRLEVPGFEDSGSESSASLPVKRTWLDAIAGRKVRITSVRAFDSTSLTDLRPAATGAPEIVALPGGAFRAGRKRGHGVTVRSGRGIFPSEAARVVETGFQGDVKKALVELAPLRWDARSQRLVWTRRLRVRVTFSGVEPSERALGGSHGRRPRSRGGKGRPDGTLLARLSTSRPGLYRVRFEDIFPHRGPALPADDLCLRRLGEAVAYHLEPSMDRFGPGSSLYFLSPGADANPYGVEAVFELERAPGGVAMPVDDASPSGPAVSTYLDRSEWEQDRYYQAGLVNAPSRWLWDTVLSPGSMTHAFQLGPISAGESRLEVYLQGASDFDASPDHHVRVSVNGYPAAETSWDGMAAKTLSVSLPSGVLHQGDNELTVENVADTAASYSMVFLDRFALTTPRPPIAEAGALEGSFTSSGRVSVTGLDGRSLLVQTSPRPRWLRGASPSVGGLSFHVEPDRRYLAASPDAVLQARVSRPVLSGLRSSTNQADYLLIAPRELLPAAEPLLELRRSQGLVSRAVSIEEIYDEFGYGEARPEALKEFLEYAYHNWRSPSVRYVVLFGDATYDPKDKLGTGVVDRVPAFMVRTTYLWTASDPRYAEVNGEDPLPDFAVGRLPAANPDEARALVEKILAYEESHQELSGPAVLVADNPDAAGDFERDSEEIASGLMGRGLEVERIYLGELGPAETRSEIVAAFDRGASLLSYVGHGGISVWGSENLFNDADVDRLTTQPRQPIVMTMNCLNGYFDFPYFDALAEALVKTEGKGAIAAFAPSGLSMNSPAHLYHQALLNELISGRHHRLGDAVLAAQIAYAESGALPELLSIYHLFGDPALVIRQGSIH